MVKNLLASAGDIRDVGSVPVSLEEGMITHSSVLSWRIPWTGEPGGLPSMGLHRVGHVYVHKHTHKEQHLNLWTANGWG